MNSTEAALYRGITGKRTVPPEGRSAAAVAETIADVVRAFGTKAPPGVSGRTWRRLRAEPGRRVTPATLRALRAAQRAVRLNPARQAWLLITPIIAIGGYVRISSDTRDRRLIVSSWAANGGSVKKGDQSGIMREVLPLWLAGDDRAAVARFTEWVGESLDNYQASLGEVDLQLTAVKFWPPGRRGMGEAYAWVGR